MAQFPTYPKTMVHPQHSPAVCSQGEAGSMSQGVPERFPNIFVTNEDQEEEARAKGYVQFGETRQLPADWAEYPMMLCHPDHEDAIPDEIVAEKTDTGIKTFTVKGTPAKFPHVFVNDESEREEWEAKGYSPPGISNPEAVITSRAVPFVPGRVTQEYPKWVDGKLIQDPRLEIGGIAQYPKYIAAHDKVVNSPEEEASLMGYVLEVPEETPTEPPVEDIKAELEALRAEVQRMRDEANRQIMTPVDPEDLPLSHSDKMKKAWERRRANAAKVA